MPRRRPPGAGPGLKTTTSFLAILLALPWISTAAQQQQPPQHHLRTEGRAHVDPVAPQKHDKHDQTRHRDDSNRSRYTPIIHQNERALEPFSSAPAAPNAAVRAPSSSNADRLITVPASARSLRDWKVEDFVLLATVDGHIHARDRNSGKELWDIYAGRPMVETIYHNYNDSGDSVSDTPFYWIVEPTEDGKLYILIPGSYPTLQPLGMTVKQLEAMSPYSTKEIPLVYTAEKRNIMYKFDARTGRVLKTFKYGGSSVVDTESCEPRATEFVGDQRECKGIFNLGQTEYTISIQNEITGEDICTIKYFEWTPNNRDRDLHSQYSASMDDKYIISRFDGQAMAWDHESIRKPWKRTTTVTHKFSSPVVRVFDVAGPQEDDSLEPALVILPQPRPPVPSAEVSHNVWLNTTDTGSWYAMSELSYPAVTDGAKEADCYKEEWRTGVYSGGLPPKRALVGVHSLEPDAYPPSHIPLIGDNTHVNPPNESEKPIIMTPSKEPPAEIDPPITITHTRNSWWPFLVTFIVLATGFGFGSYKLQQPFGMELLKKRLSTIMAKSEPQSITMPSVPKVEEVIVEDPPATELVPEVEELTPDPIPLEQQPTPEERKVRFAVPEDEEPDLEPLSRTTTAELATDDTNEVTSGNGATGSEGDAQVGQGATVEPVTPVKKKKTHRGQRGGKKKARKPKEEEVDRIVDAAKQLDQDPQLHPDELTMNGDDVQDVSNVKKIGKLTIDFDRVLGNGSGGTFVFEGKWNERVVAVKRMLPQYFGLAEQEVKLLQESDLHPNVIRYFDDEKDENFLYIAVEVCQASLWDLYRDGRPGEDLTETQIRLVNDINCDVPRALYQLALGVNHLHSLRIIHRDIKPQNILIAYPQRNQTNGPRLVISDFGLCKTLPDNVSTLIGTTGNAGTVGWKAPELILQPRELEARGSSTGYSRDSSNSTDPVSQGVKRAVDIFSLGCVFFYVLTNGSHPFDDDEGWMQIRELNIKKDKANYSQLRLGDDSEEPIALISWMLSNKPENRPTATQVMSHPFFWPAEKRLNFLCDCSDHWEREPRDPPSHHLSILESFSEEVLDKKRNFLSKLDHAFINSLGKQRKYTGDKMLDLLRALRNKKNHYEDMEESVKAKVGPLPGGYLRYWTGKFPRLVMACYECVAECGLQGEPRFRAYFEGGNERR